ncbi:MAG TPA: hypothetical protein VJV04_07445 [Nitrospiraceae bacterium]|nr:hypothetical protein [Nitrospiraceae bacterium]
MWISVKLIVLSVSVTLFPWMVGTVGAEHDFAQRLRHDAQVQSNNGHYKEAQQLRSIADALKNKDAGMAHQAQVEVGKGHIDKAMDLLKVR